MESHGHFTRHDVVFWVFVLAHPSTISHGYRSVIFRQLSYARRLYVRLFVRRYDLIFIFSISEAKRHPKQKNKNTNSKYGNHAKIDPSMTWPIWMCNKMTQNQKLYVINSIICIFFLQITIPSAGKSRRFRSRDVKRSLFLGKRLAEDQEIEDFSPLAKKVRETEERLSTCSLEVNTCFHF